MPRIQVDGETVEIEQERIAARLVELSRFDRPTTRQRSELAALAEYQARQGRLEAAARSGHVEHPELFGYPQAPRYDEPTRWSDTASGIASRARTTIDGLHQAERISDTAAQVLEAAVTAVAIDKNERTRTASWILARSSEAYARAFAKIMCMPSDMASLMLTDEDRDAISVVREGLRT